MGELRLKSVQFGKKAMLSRMSLCLFFRVVWEKMTFKSQAGEFVHQVKMEGWGKDGSSRWVTADRAAGAKTQSFARTWGLQEANKPLGLAAHRGLYPRMTDEELELKSRQVAPER